jgi:hypothetical protein
MKKKSPSPAYRLTITERQAWIISQAMEVFARLGIGQFRDALELLPLKDRPHDKTWHEDMDRIGRILATHNKESVDGWNCSLGIGNEKTADSAKVAWDLYQVIRKQLSWDQAIAGGVVQSHDSPRDWSKMMGCHYDDPMKMGPEPLGKIEVIK